MPLNQRKTIKLRKIFNLKSVYTRKIACFIVRDLRIASIEYFTSSFR